LHIHSDDHFGSKSRTSLSDEQSAARRSRAERLASKLSRLVCDDPMVADDREIDMEQILINLVAGALGGVGAGKSSPTFDLGTIGNIISGLVGGGVLGQIVTLLLPSVVAAAQSGNLTASGVITQLVAGGAGGAILTALIGAIKNRAAA
jgi:hypothetical protein